MPALTEQSHPDHLADLRQAVAQLFPILGFSPEQSATFLHRAETPGRDRFFRTAPNPHSTLLRLHIDDQNEWHVRYLIPTNWPARYDLLRQALQSLREDAIAARAAVVFIRIAEAVPSHSAYFAGMLPCFGFHLAPRCTMTAPLSAASIDPPPLPPDIVESPLPDGGLPETADLYLLAHAVHQPSRSPEESARHRTAVHAYLRRCYETPSSRATWITLTRHSEIVGLCFGLTWGKCLAIEELGIHPDLQRRGLGRYLVLRCMRQLADHFGAPDTHFFLGTNRTWQPALNLYHSLGFTIDTLETYAAFEPLLGQGGLL